MKTTQANVGLGNKFVAVTIDEGTLKGVLRAETTALEIKDESRDMEYCTTEISKTCEENYTE